MRGGRFGLVFVNTFGGTISVAGFSRFYMFPSGKEHEFASKNHYKLIVYN
jgi:hypothetical protein